jgi:VWFA-related protein
MSCKNCSTVSRGRLFRAQSMRILGVLSTVFATFYFGANQYVSAQKEIVPYEIKFDPDRDVATIDNDKGLFVKVHFSVIPVSGAAPEALSGYKVRIEEDGRLVKYIPITPPKLDEDLGVVLVLDASSLMKAPGLMDQARRAAGVFFQSLPSRTDCGLIVFNQKVVTKVPPAPDAGRLRKIIDAVQPRGGNAYLDATVEAVHMLENSPRKVKAVVLMTNGIDINSIASFEDVKILAQRRGVRVYTIGIGEPGRQDRVSTVLVLDKSGSMHLPANESDKRTKIQALREAAARYVNSIGSTRQCTILQFGDDVETPKPFTNDKLRLKRIITDIHARGETALYDAVYTATAVLDAAHLTGKRAVVALTDGIDNKSRRRVDEVIARAKEANVPLFLLGFGRKGELDVAVMTEMARQSGGKFYHASADQELQDLLEDLSIQLHENGIDEESLRKLAQETGGIYYAAKNVSRLDFVLQTVTREMKGESYNVPFLSLRQVRDGLPRHVSLKLVQSTGTAGTAERVVVEQTGSVQVKGLVIAEMTPSVYLLLLVILVFLIILPGLFRSRSRSIG